jgi:hypothetical protein
MSNGGTTTCACAKSWIELQNEALRERRAILEEIGRRRTEAEIPLGSLGIAFSGGGIRSATISLGVAQAFEREDRLLDFDFCSTVSGGGYFGSFLGSLFVPESARGPDAAVPLQADTNEQKKKADFAKLALTSQARDTVLEYEPSIPRRNPIWWLREHSRYLAPNGASDYLIGATYLIRNWIAMLYVYALPVCMLMIILIGATVQGLKSWGGICKGGKHAGLMDHLFLDADRLMPCQMALGEYRGVLLSPAFGLLAICFFFTLAASTAFWLTEPLSGATKGSKRRLFWPVIGSFIGLYATYLIYDRLEPAPLPSLHPESWTPFILLVVGGAALLLLSLLVLGIATLLTVSGDDKEGDAFTADLRRRVTRLHSWADITFVAILALALIDTAGMWFYEWARTAFQTSQGFWGTIFAFLPPLGAWLVNKLPGWFGDGRSKIGKLFGKHLWTIALFVGVGLYGLMAILLHAVLQYFLLDGAPLIHAAAAHFPTGGRLAFFAVMIGILLLLTGLSTPFINLSSLHGIYAARLTRAYLGASNMNRLKSAVEGEPGHTSITESDGCDQIPVSIYQQARSAAPLHLINVTLNETISREKSQLLERDRKGVPLVFGPEGVFVNADRGPSDRRFYSWPQLVEERVEGLSVGQLCAISGAAASTAMGSRTTLGGALAMTFANVRLGYWWNTKDMIRGRVLFEEQPGRWLWQLCTVPLRTYFYLWNEMTARYSRDYSRLNISDGGHFENSGAYELLRRNVKTIFVCDNGADPDYLFEDLEQLVRKARLDLGLSINTASRDKVIEAFGKNGAKLFLNGVGDDWRGWVRARKGRTTKPDDTTLFLLFEVYEDDDHNGAPTLAGHIVWMKPSKYVGLTQDVIGYGNAHPDFPHETTADQFFDEAQWESYRALGQCMVSQLLSQSKGKNNVLRNLHGLWEKGVEKS